LVLLHKHTGIERILPSVAVSLLAGEDVSTTTQDRITFISAYAPDFWTDVQALCREDKALWELLPTEDEYRPGTAARMEATLREMVEASGTCYGNIPKEGEEDTCACEHATEESGYPGFFNLKERYGRTAIPQVRDELVRHAGSCPNDAVDSPGGLSVWLDEAVRILERKPKKAPFTPRAATRGGTPPLSCAMSSRPGPCIRAVHAECLRYILLQDWAAVKCCFLMMKEGHKTCCVAWNHDHAVRNMKVLKTLAAMLALAWDDASGLRACLLGGTNYGHGVPKGGTPVTHAHTAVLAAAADAYGSLQAATVLHVECGVQFSEQQALGLASRHKASASQAEALAFIKAHAPETWEKSTKLAEERRSTYPSARPGWEYIPCTGEAGEDNRRVHIFCMLRTMSDAEIATSAGAAAGASGGAAASDDSE